MEQFEMKTRGINYEPNPDDEHRISSAHLGMNITAEVNGQEVTMKPDSWVCGSGCRAALTPQAETDPGSVIRPVSIIRFAKFGTSKLPTGHEFDWLVTLEEGKEFSGSLTTPGEDIDEAGYLVLSMGMQLTMRINGQVEPVVLRSRKTPTLEGPVEGWPPYNAPLHLSNGPISYFQESEIADSAAVPFVTVTSNEAVIGSEPYALLSRTPSITQVHTVDKGAHLHWTDTAAEIHDRPPITSYHVYRNDTPGDPEGWSMIASVPRDQTDYLDSDFSEEAGAEYLVFHAAELIFGYELECLVGTPWSIPPIAGT
jgi:hypothetical protein